MGLMKIKKKKHEKIIEKKTCDKDEIGGKEQQHKSEKIKKKVYKR